MTSAHKINPQHQRSQGFTLIEIIVTMVIISILLGSAVLFLSQNNRAEVAEIAQKTQILAKETLREAKLSNRAQSIFISSREIWTTPESGAQSDGTETDTPTQRIEIPEGVTVSFLDNTRWIPLAKNDQPFIWTFTSSGLCDSITLKFESDDAVNQMKFHSLTAGELSDAY